MFMFPRSRAGSRVVAVLFCEVVEPFFSRAAAPQGNAGGCRRSTGLFRLALRREGLSFQGRRADATVSPLVLLCLYYSIFTSSNGVGLRWRATRQGLNQVRDASRTHGCLGDNTRAAFLFFSP